MIILERIQYEKFFVPKNERIRYHDRNVTEYESSDILYIFHHYTGMSKNLVV